MNVELLSRLQFAGTIMFHYLFPPLTIGLGVVMVILEGAFLRTKNPAWEAAARFWTRLFALNFALGVATGIVMEFEFGTNWAAYSRFVGDVFGSALAAEGIFAFFLESGFLAVLVFGWDRVKPITHFFATIMVAVGSMFSAVWIVIANSWQQTPAGYHIVPVEGDGHIGFRAEVTDFWAMVFNPSSVDRLTHVLVGALILGGFFVMSISAWYLLKRKHEDVARRSFTVGLFVAAVASLGALLTGHVSAQGVARNQPAKLAAMEAHFHTETGPTGLYVFGWPVPSEEKVYGLQIPYMLTFLAFDNFTTPVTGLDHFPKEDHPPVWLTFQAFHLMVGLGTLFVALTWFAMFLLWRRALFQKRWLLWIFVFAVIGPYIANQAGWITAEVGRQPWVVYPSVQNGVEMMGLRTAEGVSESVRAGQVLWSIIMFGLIYFLLFCVWVWVMNEKIKHGPETPGEREAVLVGNGFLQAGGARVAHGGGHMTTPDNPASDEGGAP